MLNYRITWMLVLIVCVSAQDLCDSEFEFKCNTGECFPAYVKCDGYPTCPNGEDEDSCGLQCFQCDNEWHTARRGCRETWSGSKFGAPLCAEDEICITKIKKTSKQQLKFFRDCFSKELCLARQSKNPPECYEDPVHVSTKCVFCCEESYCNQFTAEDAVMV
ncbi:uncharacterized protein LOC100372854 [Saccoglossus kowalevskii]|uniref:Low-density lipoprotein receptor-related protein 1B-like n=1 Tax=Saccoglossus kowalevskii TaxID=10224 RepID=A0ABM0MZD1_SACKO|nr:PREDICTED: low-density lipoprotein receptor-related protein 1B-like [Saccoglossus kowalevskii]